MLMSPELRRLVVGLASGLFQSPSYLFPQMLGAIAVSIGVSTAQLAWLVPVGYVLPVVVGLLMAAGDLIGGRTLLIGLAAGTTAGVALVAAAGVAHALDAPTLAYVLLVAGALLIPAAVRHGALAVSHETRQSDAERNYAKQLREAGALRRYLVMGIYMTPLPAGAVAGAFGWVWAFAGLAVVQLVALVLLASTAKREQRPRRRSSQGFVRDLIRCFVEPRLAWAAAGAFVAQGTVFCFVGGLPLAMAALGFSPTAIGAVAFSAMAAVLFVGFSGRSDELRFGRWAGATPLAGLVVLAVVVGATAGREAGDGRWTVVGVIQAVALGVAAIVIELAKQWSQTIAMVQARWGASSSHDYRRQASVLFGANVGALAGAGVGTMSAAAGQHVWLGVLLAAAALAWALQASWFRGLRSKAVGS